MKRLLMLGLFCVPVMLFGDEPIGNPHHLESCLMVDNSWVLVLDDNSCWELSPMQPKEQSWKEWWQGAKPSQPDERFLVDLTTWKRGGAIQVIKPDASPTQDYPYLLNHIGTGQLVSAKLLQSDEMCVPKTGVAKSFQQMGSSKPCTVRDTCELQGVRFLILDDGSIWEMKKLRENTRSISQWWSGVELEQPDTPFLFSSANWKASTPLVLAAYHWGSLGLSEVYQYTNGAHHNCSYLFENPETGEMAYATPSSAHELVSRFTRYAEERYAAGHAAGYSSGYSAGNSAGYASGKSVGYKSGHTAGYQSGLAATSKNTGHLGD